MALPRLSVCLALLALALPVQARTADDAAHGQDPALRASQPPPPVIASPVSIPLDASRLDGLARHAVVARVHEAELHCEGVALIDLLRANGAIPEGRLDSPHLARYVQVDARDGFRVLFSLAELDPGTGDRAAWVVDRCDGQPLDDATGPLRLLVPGDARGARSVRQLDAINVVVAP